MNTTSLFKIFMIEYKSRLTLVLYGYVAPAFIISTIIVNFLFTIILLKASMRSPANSLLVAIATADAFTGVSLAPFTVYYYSMENANKPVLFFSFCFYSSVAFFLASIFHSVSIWLTIALAIQRFICLRFPFKVGLVCGMRSSLIIIIVVSVVSLGVNVPNFFQNEIQMQWVPLEQDQNSTLISACAIRDAPWLQNNKYYRDIDTWINMVFFNWIPGVSLTILSALMVQSMRRVSRERLYLRGQQTDRQVKIMSGKFTRTTTMLMVVVVTFTLSEIPIAVIRTLYLVQKYAEHSVIKNFEIISAVPNTWVLMTCPINFIIYCVMSQQFRKQFLVLLRFHPSTI